MNEKEQVIGGIILNLSLDGRIAKMRLPHYSKKERIGAFMEGVRKYKIKLTKPELNRFWGARFTKHEIISLVKQIAKR